jgi:hypothetical protein
MQNIGRIWVAPFIHIVPPIPPSSNPLNVYRNIYEEWKDQDEYGKYINQLRLNLRKGVAANTGILPAGWDIQLKKICDNIDIIFLYPFVYRVDITKLNPIRLALAGSGLAGSDEYLVDDLDEREFDLLFNDYENDSDFVTLKSGTISSNQALSILEGRC